MKGFVVAMSHVEILTAFGLLDALSLATSNKTFNGADINPKMIDIVVPLVFISSYRGTYQ